MKKNQGIKGEQTGSQTDTGDSRKLTFKVKWEKPARSQEQGNTDRNSGESNNNNMDEKKQTKKSLLKYRKHRNQRL